MASKSARKDTVVLVGTRKGLFILMGDRTREKWRAEGPHFLGQIVNHAVLNPATGTMLVAARAGHLGPTVFRSTDSGKSFKEATSPPEDFGNAGGEAASLKLFPESVERNTVGPRWPARAATSMVPVAGLSTA